MPKSSYFLQECPACGRGLHVRVVYLGRQVVCQHCGRHFTARDPAMNSRNIAPPEPSLLDRAEELLQMAEQRRVYPR